MQGNDLSPATTASTQEVNSEVDKQTPQELFEIMKSFQVSGRDGHIIVEHEPVSLMMSLMMMLFSHIATRSPVASPAFIHDAGELIMFQLLIKTNPEEAKLALTANPQLAYALLQVRLSTMTC